MNRRFGGVADEGRQTVVDAGNRGRHVSVADNDESLEDNVGHIYTENAIAQTRWLSRAIRTMSRSCCVAEAMGQLTVGEGVVAKVVHDSRRTTACRRWALLTRLCSGNM